MGEEKIRSIFQEKQRKKYALLYRLPMGADNPGNQNLRHDQLDMSRQEDPRAEEETPKPNVKDEDIDRILSTLIDGKRIYLSD